MLIEAGHAGHELELGMVRLFLSWILILRHSPFLLVFGAHLLLVHVHSLRVLRSSSFLHRLSVARLFLQCRLRRQLRVWILADWREVISVIEELLLEILKCEGDVYTLIEGGLGELLSLEVLP